MEVTYSLASQLIVTAFKQLNKFRSTLLERRIVWLENPSGIQKLWPRPWGPSIQRYPRTQDHRMLRQHTESSSPSHSFIRFEVGSVSIWILLRRCSDFRFKRPKCRESLQFVLSVLHSSVRPEFQSGGRNIQRLLTSGKQSYSTDEKDWPVNKPLTKLESLVQCSGGEPKWNYIML
jgi:hypothetical protein